MRPRPIPALGPAAPLAALLLALLTAAAAPRAAADDGDGPPAPAPDSWYARSAVAALHTADATRDPGSAGVAALNSALADGVHSLHGLAPGWLRRSEVELRLGDDDLRPRYEVQTVQPLYRSRSGRDTVFVQGRLASGDAAGEEDGAMAAGDALLGYRRLVHGDQIIVGANGFYDMDAADGRRLGVGAEVRSRPLELTAAWYGALPDEDGDAAAVTEGAAGGADAAEVAAGYEIGVGAQLPYLPWARVYGEKYRREPGLLRPGIDGERFGLSLTPLEPLQVELGGESDASADPGYFARLRYTYVFGPSATRPVRDPLIDRDPLAFEDVSGRHLDRVDR